MKTIEEQLARYKTVHLNSQNVNTHFIGVPLIVLAVTLLLNSVKFVVTSDALLPEIQSIALSLAMIAFTFVFIYYLMLHRTLALGMLVYMIINLMIAHALEGTDGLLYIAVALFVVGWIFQFIGHFYEKAKPAFVDDLSQFLIGPLFLMAEVYFILGLEPKLNAVISAQAKAQRKILDEKQLAN